MAGISGRAMSKAAISSDATANNLQNFSTELIEDFEYDAQENERAEPRASDTANRYVDGLPDPVVRFTVSPDTAASGIIRVAAASRAPRAFDFQIASGGDAKEGWKLTGVGRVILGRFVRSARDRSVRREVRIVPQGQPFTEAFTVD